MELKLSKMNLLTIVIPCYNGSKYFERLFRCLNGQDDQNFDVIFVDNNSTDNSAEILKAECAKRENYHYYLETRAGVSNARNGGISQVKTPYILFMDCDDIIAKNLIKTVNELLNKYGEEYLVCYKIKNIFSIPDKLYSSPIKIRKISFEESTNQDGSFLIDYLSCKYQYSALSRIYSVNKLKKLPNYPDLFKNGIIYAEDVVFGSEFMRMIPKIALIKSPMYYYVQNRNSAVNSKFRPEKMSGCLKMMEILNNADPAQEENNNYLHMIVCFLSVEMLFRMLVSHYKEQKDISLMFQGYKQNKKYIRRCPKAKIYVRLFFPLLTPLFYLFFGKKLKTINN